MKFKKIATVIAGALMVGATMGAASAASYPSQLTSGGVTVVVGTDGAAASDMSAATAIEADLQEEMDASSMSGAVTVTGGDSYKLEKTSVKYHLGDSMTSVVSATLDDDELPTLLAQGKFIDNDNDEFDFSQKIVLAPSSLTMWEDNDYADNEPTVGFRIASGSEVLNYTITFDDEPTLDDLLTSTVPIMGKEYYVLANSTNSSSMSLTLLDSAVDTVLSEGDSTTLNVGGASYEVSISFIGATEVKLDVNGETTNGLGESDTYKLSDGSYVGIKDISVQDYAGGIKQVEFSIGSGKLKLTSGSDVQINDQAISGVSSTITHAAGSLTSIQIEWKADDDLFVTEGTEITLPEFETVKISYGGLNYPTEEVIEVVQGGDTYMTLNDFPLKDGSADIDFLYGSSGGPFSGIGKDATHKLITTNSTQLNFDKDTDEYFIVSYAATTEGESYLMRATNFILDGSTEKADIQYYSDGQWVTKKTVKATDTFSMGNAELGIKNVNRTAKYVNVTANSSSTNFFHLYSAEGLRTYLPFESGNITAGAVGAINFTNGANIAGHNATSFYLNFTEEDKDGNIGSGYPFGVVVGWDSSTTAEPEVSDLIGENVTNIEIEETDVWRTFMYGPLATEFLWEKPTSGQDSIKVVYHGDEVEADVYVTSADATLSGDAIDVQVIDDVEADSATGNLVVVGGNCVNAVARDLLGLTGGATCQADFMAETDAGNGNFLIKSFARGDDVALLVAGYSAADTTKAKNALIAATDLDVSVGKAYMAESTTTADATLVAA